MRRVIAVVGILFSAALAEAASPPSAQLTVTLQLQAGTTLPGVPVAFHVTFTNAGGGPLAVPARAVLLVRDDGGQSFLAASDVVRTIVVVEEWAGQKIPPHQDASYTLSTRGLMNHPAWFVDYRLSRPGRFELQIMVGDDLREEIGIDGARQLAAVSNTVTLTVQEPSGADAEVWSLMRAAGGNWGPGLLFGRAGQEIAKRVLAEYPNSAYASWFASTCPASTAEERESILRNWLSGAPEDSNINWRRFQLAQLEIALANKYADTQPERSQSYETKARAILNAILKVTGDDELTKHAKERLDYLDDPPIEW
jgi:hypothetical protein